MPVEVPLAHQDFTATFTSKHKTRIKNNKYQIVFRIERGFHYNIMALYSCVLVRGVSFGVQPHVFVQIARVAERPVAVFAFQRFETGMSSMRWIGKK